MELQLEELNRIYRSELNKFLGVIDFENLNQVKETIITSICNYFDSGFKNLIRYDKDVIAERIEEVFGYGLSRTRATIDEMGFIKYDATDNFDSKNRQNTEERNNLINKFNSENPANNFSDLDERISILITDYLAKINYDNQNYEKYHFKIKISILKYVASQKKNMLDILKMDLEKQSQELEKVVLLEFKNIVTDVDMKINNIETSNLVLQPSLIEPSNNFPNLMPILDLDDDNDNYNSNDNVLPRDIIK